MSKKKRKSMPRDAAGSTSTSKKPAGDVITGSSYPTEEIKWWREAIEGLVVAIVLALLIRGFEAEAFVIPTGSMASTLRGRHKDVKCEECQKEYATGSSLDTERSQGQVVTTVCPICANPQRIEYIKGRDASFAGDRILVNKFSYDPLGKPERFDVIVFKNPNDAKQNYIKRLCGLPGETILLKRGDIFARSNSDPNAKFLIAQKPPRKLRALLQIVDDTTHRSPAVQAAGMPPRWQPESGTAWTPDATSQSFKLAADTKESWIRYRNYIPSAESWTKLQNDQPVSLSTLRPSLITDTYAYNSSVTERAAGQGHVSTLHDRGRGKNWVGDLAVEAKVKVESDSGELLLDLVEGGWHFQCSIDVSTGSATLTVTDPNGQPGNFLDSQSVSADTPVKGRGSYEVLFSNVDSGLRLWVNDKLMAFDKTTTYTRSPAEDEFALPLRPFFGGPDNPGDAAPVGIGGVNLQANVDSIKVHRDVYYVAEVYNGGDPAGGDYNMSRSPRDIDRIFHSPDLWSEVELFDDMQEAIFELEDSDDDAKDQFFPMGDNSPHSLDARLWRDNYVERQFLIGEAVFIYYPHPWAVKLPGERFRSLPLLFYPKFSRMGVIR